MAKRYKEEAAENEPEFKMPPFDQQKFITNEKRNIKIVFISFLLGILIAVISFGFWVLLTGSEFQWALVFLVGLANMAWVRFIVLRLHIDLKDFTRGKWISAYATYFFTWLLILIILVNPPFYDGESPVIQAVTLPGAQTPGGTVLVVATITDNVKVAGVNFTYTDPNGTTHTPTSTSYQNSVFQFLYTPTSNTPGAYNYTLTATDPSDHRTVVKGNFTYSNSTLTVSSSQTLGLRSGDTISIRADPRISTDNFLVYYTLNDNTTINATRKGTDKEHYETSPEFQGWRENTTYTMIIHAEASHYFLNNPVRYSNNVTSSAPYTVSTGVDTAIGATADPAPNYKLPEPQTQGATPGFEILVALGALAVVLIVVRKKRRKQ